MFMDIVLINLSFIGAFLLRFDGNLRKVLDDYMPEIVYLAIATTCMKIAFNFAFKLYNSLWKYAGAYEAFYIILASACSNAILTIYLLFTIIVPRSIFIITFFIDIFTMGGVRFAYRIFRRIVNGGMLIRQKDVKRIMVIGGGEAGAIIIRDMKIHPELKMVPAVIIDEDPSKIGKKLNGVPIVAESEGISHIAQKYKIDEIIIAIPSASTKKLNDLFNKCSEAGCKVKILPSVTQLIDESVVIQKVRDVDIEDLLGRDPIKLDLTEISAFLEGQTVLVTGGGGSIGSELCRQVAAFNPKQLIILDNYENNAYEIQNELLYKYPKLNLVTIIANIREMPRMNSIFAKYKPDVVFHAAAHKHVPLMETNPTEAIKNNVFGTLNVAECASKYKAKKFVLISTDKAVNPTNIMGATKRIAEMIIQAIDRISETEFVAVRFGNVLGSNGSVIPLFKKQIEHGGPVTVTHPEITRFFMTITEAVQLVMQAAAMAKGGEIFVLDMGEPVKIYDLAKKLIKLSGFKPEVDINIEFTGLRPGEKLYEELLMAEEGLRATKHDKIFVAPPILKDFKTLKKEIEQLSRVIINDSEDITEVLKEIVPTYNKRDAS